MNSYCAYAFLAGIYIGGYTNLFSKLVISGLVIYIIHPDNFNIKRFTPLYNSVHNWTYPYLSKVYYLAPPKLLDNLVDERISDITDIDENINASSILSPERLHKLPPLPKNDLYKNKSK